MSLSNSSICSDEELLAELKKLGYNEISDDVFNMMKDDLVELFEKEQCISPSSNVLLNSDLSELKYNNFPDVFVPRKTKKDSKSKIVKSVGVKKNVLPSPEKVQVNDVILKNRNYNGSNIFVNKKNTAYGKCAFNTDASQSNSKCNHKVSARVDNACIDFNENSSLQQNFSHLTTKENCYNSNSSSSTKSVKNTTFPSQKSKTVKQIFSSSSVSVTHEPCDLLGATGALYDSENNSPLKQSSSESSINTEVRTIKRKVLRKKNGQSLITEEFLEIPSQFNTSYPESEFLADSKSFSSDDLSPKSNNSSKSVSVVSSGIKSSSNLSVLSTSTSLRIFNSRKKKHDPVAMYSYYKKFWDNFKPPGEKTHDKLRWAVRDRMLDYDL